MSGKHTILTRQKSTPDLKRTIWEHASPQAAAPRTTNQFGRKSQPPISYIFENDGTRCIPQPWYLKPSSKRGQAALIKAKNPEGGSEEYMSALQIAPTELQANTHDREPLQSGLYLFAIPVEDPKVMILYAGKRERSITDIVGLPAWNQQTITIVHPCVVNNQPVYGAGMFKVDNNMIVEILPNASGHYRPTIQSAKLVIWIFANLGYYFEGRVTPTGEQNRDEHLINIPLRRVEEEEIPKRRDQLVPSPSKSENYMEVPEEVWTENINGDKSYVTPKNLPRADSVLGSTMLKGWYLFVIPQNTALEEQLTEANQTIVDLQELVDGGGGGSALEMQEELRELRKAADQTDNELQEASKAADEIKIIYRGRDKSHELEFQALDDEDDEVRVFIEHPWLVKNEDVYSAGYFYVRNGTIEALYPNLSKLYTPSRQSGKFAVQKFSQMGYNFVDWPNAPTWRPF